jgi:hypothetical protein
MNVGLNGFKKIITSLDGEDGIIEEILNRIGVENAYCVEFGAWDGKHLSNTWQLWHDKGWSALLIEGDPNRVADLDKSIVSFPKVTSFCAFVGLEGDDRLDAILSKVDAPDSIDVLSIDIDGDDFHIFKSISLFSPRVVLIEFNPTIPPHIELTSEPGGRRLGASALSIYKLAKEKKYSLAACTSTNLIFVRDADFWKLAIEEPKLAEVMPMDHIMYVVSDFDGTCYIPREPTFWFLPKLSFKSLFRVYRKKVFGNHKDSASQIGSLIPVSIFSERTR